MEPDGGENANMRPASGESECLLSETNRIAMYTLHYGPEHFVTREIL